MKIRSRNSHPKRLPKHVFKIRRLYYFRYLWPKDIAHRLNKKELRLALKTRYISTARKRAEKLSRAILTYIENSRSMDLTDQQIKDLLNDYIQSGLAAEEQFNILTEKPYSPEELAEHLEAMEFILYDRKEELALNDYKNVTKSSKALLKEHDIEFDEQSLEYKKFRREFLKAEISLLEKSLKGESPAQIENKHTENQPRLTQIIPKFIDEFETSGRWTEKTKSENEAVFNLFLEIAGDLPIDSYNNEAFRSYKDILKKLPANKNKIKKYKDKSIKEVLALPDVKPMAVNTINKNIRRLSQLFKWAVQNGYLQRNIVEGMSLPEKKRQDQYREVFTKGDLEKIFSTPIHQTKEYRYSYYYWLPLLGLYTGARIEEICSLYLEDFRVEHGIDVISINSNHDKKLKSKAAQRLIPLHPQLVSLGLLDHVIQLKEKKAARLFPELARNRDGYSQTPSRWFGNFKRQVGIASPTKVFHSFRHTVSNTLKQSGVPKDQAAEILGHDQGKDVTYGRYGKPTEAKRQLKAILKLDYGLMLN